MNLLEAFRAMFGAAKAEGITFDGVTPDATPEQALAAALPPDPRVAEEIATLKSQIAAQQASARREAAAAFAADQVRSRKAMPAEQEALAALHLQAAEDDARDGGERVARLGAVYASRPAHTLTTEQVPDGALVALANNVTAEADADQKRRLMQMTAVGRTALKGL